MALQLSLDASDRLAEALTQRQEPLSLTEAAVMLLRASRVPGILARRVLDDVVSGDARLVWLSAASIGLASWHPQPAPLDQAVFCVVDLETTGTNPRRDRIVEIGAVRISQLQVDATFEQLVDPLVAVPAAVTRLTGISTAGVAGRATIRHALPRLLAFAGDAVVVAHNARFDTAFLDSALQHVEGRRLACPVIDTVALARRLLPGRRGYGLALLAERFDTTTKPCHRALSDALATAEVLLILIGRAQERGARSVEDLMALTSPPERRAQTKRQLAAAAPAGPGTYVMRDGRGQPLYVGTSRDLRRRTLTYFAGTAQPRAVERILGAVERIDTHQAGSTLEARLDELQLIQSLRPRANRRGARPDRACYLRLEPGPPARLSICTGAGLDGALYAGPVGNRAEAERLVTALRLGYGLRSCTAAAPSEDRCLEGRLGRCLAPCRNGVHADAHAEAALSLSALLVAGGVMPLRRISGRRRTLAKQLRFEEASTLRDAALVLRRAGTSLGRLRAARRRHGVILAAHRTPALVTGFGVAHGLVVERRSLTRAGSGALEATALACAVSRAVAAGPGLEGPVAVEASRREEALLVHAAFQRPPIGVRTVAYEPNEDRFVAAIVAARSGVAASG